MTYTIQLDFFIDDDVIKTDKEVQEIAEEAFACCNCSASNVKVLAVND